MKINNQIYCPSKIQSCITHGNQVTFSSYKSELCNKKTVDDIIVNMCIQILNQMSTFNHTVRIKTLKRLGENILRINYKTKLYRKIIQKYTDNYYHCCTLTFN